MKQLSTALSLIVALLALPGGLDTAHAIGSGLPSSPPDIEKPPVSMPTVPNEATPVWKVQLYVQVCDLPYASTGNTVVASLNGYNYTALDTPGQDFERASVLTYELLLTSVLTLSNIEYLKISKAGHDGVCIQNLRVYVNETLIYARTYASGQWLDEAYYGYDSRTLLIPGSTLRGHSAWSAWTSPPRPNHLTAVDIASRLVTAVGTGMYSYNILDEPHSMRWEVVSSHWCDMGYGARNAMCISKRDDTAIYVELLLYFKCVDPVFGDGFCSDTIHWYDVDLRFTCVAGMVLVTKENEKVGPFGGGLYGAAGVSHAVQTYVGPKILDGFVNIRFPSCPSIHVDSVFVPSAPDFQATIQFGP